MKTRQEVDSLKASWRGDPIWDIEDTEGFEEHREELFVYRKSCEREWSQARESRVTTFCNRVGLDPDTQWHFAQYVMELEARIKGLEGKS